MIFLFMAGGPSHLETFDPKPLLNKLDGQRRPAEFGEVQYQNVNSQSRILGTKRTFKKYGKSGIEIQIYFPTRRRLRTSCALFVRCTAIWWFTPRRSIR